MRRILPASARPRAEWCNGGYLGDDRSIRCHFDGHPRRGGSVRLQAVPANSLHDDFDAWAKSYESPFDDLVIATAKRNWDHELRISEMDADGVAAEVLLPNTIPPFFPTTPNITISLPSTRDEFEKRWAGVQAHNRWQIDFCSLAPPRR